MSLYRSVRRKGWKIPLVLSAICLVTGFLFGLLLGSKKEKATVRDTVTALQENIKPAFNALELSVIEYNDSVKNGKVVAPSEYKAAEQDIEKLEDTFDQTKSDLDALDSDKTGSVEEGLGRLKILVREKAPAAEVEEAADSLKRNIRSASGFD